MLNQNTRSGRDTHSREWHKINRAEKTGFAFVEVRAKMDAFRAALKGTVTNSSVRLEPKIILPGVVNMRDWRMALKANRERAERERTASNRAKRK